jgi:hypothetical protein
MDCEGAATDVLEGLATHQLAAEFSGYNLTQEPEAKVCVVCID